jgi:hypothetical protein
MMLKDIRVAIGLVEQLNLRPQPTKPRWHDGCAAARPRRANTVRRPGRHWRDA